MNRLHEDLEVATEEFGGSTGEQFVIKRSGDEANGVPCGWVGGRKEEKRKRTGPGSAR